MEANIKETLRAEFEKLREEIVANYEASGMSASGNWGESVQVQELPNGFTIVADVTLTDADPARHRPAKP